MTRATTRIDYEAPSLSAQDIWVALSKTGCRSPLSLKLRSQSARTSLAISKSLTPMLGKEIVIRQAGEMTVVFNKEAQKVVETNATGGFVLKAIDGRSSVDTIASKFARKYKLSKAKAIEDVLAFMEGLVQMEAGVSFRNRRS